MSILETKRACELGKIYGKLLLNNKSSTNYPVILEGVDNNVYMFNITIPFDKQNDQLQLVINEKVVSSISAPKRCMGCPNCSATEATATFKLIPTQS